MFDIDWIIKGSLIVLHGSFAVVAHNPVWKSILVVVLLLRDILPDLALAISIAVKWGNLVRLLHPGHGAAIVYIIVLANVVIICSVRSIFESVSGAAICISSTCHAYVSINII